GERFGVRIVHGMIWSRRFIQAASMFPARHFQRAMLVLAVAAACFAAPGRAQAQAHLREAPSTSTPSTSTPSAIVPPGGDPMAVPGFWDPRRRPERPDLTRINGIRFLTEIDYPPFNYAGADGQPAGFNVDLARLICEEIKVPCTIQFRRFDTLLEALAT